MVNLRFNILRNCRTVFQNFPFPSAMCEGWLRELKEIIYIMCLASCLVIVNLQDMAAGVNRDLNRINTTHSTAAFLPAKKVDLKETVILKY